MGLCRTSSHARIAPVAQHCTHDFVFVFVCGEDRSSVLSLVCLASSISTSPLSICILGLDSCSLVGNRLDDCLLQQATHMVSVSRFNEPAVVS